MGKMENQKPKSVKLEEETRVKLNKAKSIYLGQNPKTRTCSDNFIVNVALTNYINSKEGKKK